MRSASRLRNPNRHLSLARVLLVLSRARAFSFSCHLPATKTTRQLTKNRQNAEIRENSTIPAIRALRTNNERQNARRVSRGVFGPFPQGRNFPREIVHFPHGRVEHGQPDCLTRAHVHTHTYAYVCVRGRNTSTYSIYIKVTSFLSTYSINCTSLLPRLRARHDAHASRTRRLPRATGARACVRTRTRMREVVSRWPRPPRWPS